MMFVSIMVLGIAYAIYKLFELYACRKERIMLIEKMSFTDGIAAPPPDVSKWFSQPAPKMGALRLGLLLTGLGLGLCLAIIMNSWMKLSGYHERDAMYVALLLFFGGLGLVIANLIEQKNRKKD